MVTNISQRRLVFYIGDPGYFGLLYSSACKPKHPIIDKLERFVVLSFKLLGKGIDFCRHHIRFYSLGFKSVVRVCFSNQVSFYFYGGDRVAADIRKAIIIAVVVATFK